MAYSSNHRLTILENYQFGTDDTRTAFLGSMKLLPVSIFLTSRTVEFAIRVGDKSATLRGIRIVGSATVPTFFGGHSGPPYSWFFV